MKSVLFLTEVIQWSLMFIVVLFIMLIITHHAFYQPVLDLFDSFFSSLFFFPCFVNVMSSPKTHCNYSLSPCGVTKKRKMKMFEILVKVCDTMPHPSSVLNPMPRKETVDLMSRKQNITDCVKAYLDAESLFNTKKLFIWADSDELLLVSVANIKGLTHD